MAKEKSNEEIQKKYLELQLLVRQINDLQQQIITIQTQTLELRNLKENIEKFKEIKPESESYVPLGLNIFAKSKLTDNKEFLVAVGSNIMVTKTLDETADLIGKQVIEIEKIVIELEAQLNELDLKGQDLQMELVDLSKQ